MWPGFGYRSITETPSIHIFGPAKPLARLNQKLRSALQRALAHMPMCGRGQLSIIAVYRPYRRSAQMRVLRGFIPLKLPQPLRPVCQMC